MRHFPVESLLVTAAVALIPGLSQAALRSQAMEGCVAAFMQALSQHAPPKKLRESRFIDNGEAPLLTRTMVLTANDAHDHHVVAQALCRVDGRGQVTRLEELPANALLP